MHTSMSVSGRLVYLQLNGGYRFRSYGEVIRRYAFRAKETVPHPFYRSADGYAAFRAAVAPFADGRPFFEKTIETGTHRASLRALAGDLADVCTVDAVCWSLAIRHDAAITNRLRLIGQTPMTPGLPLICAISRTDSEVAAIREALAEAITEDIDPAARSALMLDGLEILPEHDYDAISAMGEAADALGYKILH